MLSPLIKTISFDSFLTKIFIYLKKNDKIRIGFFSSDIYKQHSVTHFLKTVLNNYNKDKFEIYLYLNNKEEDNTSNYFQNLAFKSQNLYHLSDIEVINLIRRDNIDVIFDLMVITSSNRLNLFKNRFAPNQISWLGYCNTSGLDEMDYIIADNNLIKKNEENLYSEKIIFLKNIWSCHAGFDLPRKELVSPCLNKDQLTFGSFNNFNKINDNVINVWSTILKKMDNAKLILKSSLNIHIMNLQEKFDRHGVLDSVVFVKNEEFFENHLKMYENIDVALDTFPYNGVTTSFESIWMGVPVITMEGFNFNSRCGESINRNIGMDYLISKNEEEYISKAIQLGNDKKKLLEIRKKIFHNCLSSPLFNQKDFSYNFFGSIENIL